MNRYKNINFKGSIIGRFRIFWGHSSMYNFNMEIPDRAKIMSVKKSVPYLIFKLIFYFCLKKMYTDYLFNQKYLCPSYISRNFYIYKATV